MKAEKRNKIIKPSAFSLQPCRLGFTLIEIIIVLIIIAIASGLVGILVSKGSENLKIRTFTKDVSAVLRYARSHAASEKKTFCFVINKSERMYRLYADNYEDEERVEIVPVITKPIPDGLQITMDESDKDTLYVEFSPYGNSTGGAIEIRNQKGTTFFIIVNRVSGKVEVEKAE